MIEASFARESAAKDESAKTINEKKSARKNFVKIHVCDELSEIGGKEEAAGTRTLTDGGGESERLLCAMSLALVIGLEPLAGRAWRSLAPKAIAVKSDVHVLAFLVHPLTDNVIEGQGNLGSEVDGILKKIAAKIGPSDLR